MKRCLKPRTDPAAGRMASAAFPFGRDRKIAEWKARQSDVKRGRRPKKKPGAQAENTSNLSVWFLVGVGRLELPASWSRTKRATKLRYTPAAFPV